MTTEEVGRQLVALCREGRFVDAVDTLYSDSVISVEARELGGMNRELRGKVSVRGKNLWWFENNEVHSIQVDGPFFSPERFAVLYTFDHTAKASGERRQFQEVGVYTVSAGKVVREEFLYDR